MRDKDDGGGSGGSIYLECNELIYKKGFFDSLGVGTMIISAIGGLSTYEYRENEYLTITKCGGDGRIRIKQNKYKEDEFVDVNEIFQKRIYPKPYWGKKFTDYEIKIYESVTINPEMDRILDEMKAREKEREKEYNMDIVHQLVILGYGTKSQIMDAIDEVTNKNDINEIIEYLEKQKH